MGGQVISLLWKDLSDGCGETNCDSMQNGGITFMFINKETFSFSATFFSSNIWLLSQRLISTEMLCVLWNCEACGHFATINKVVNVVGDTQPASFNTYVKCPLNLIWNN